jgi:hypothetical protein
MFDLILAIVSLYLTINIFAAYDQWITWYKRLENPFEFMIAPQLEDQIEFMIVPQPIIRPTLGRSIKPSYCIHSAMRKPIIQI